MEKENIMIFIVKNKSFLMSEILVFNKENLINFIAIIFSHEEDIDLDVIALTKNNSCYYNQTTKNF